MTQPPKESESNTPTNEQKNKEQQQEAKRDEKPPITVTMRYDKLKKFYIACSKSPL